MGEVALQWATQQADIQALFVSLRQSGELSDVTLTNGSCTLKCHRLVLSAACPSFHDVLKSYTRDVVLYMGAVSSAVLEALVEFMYRGRVPLQQQHLPEFLQLAKQWGLRGLWGDGGLSIAANSASAPVVADPACARAAREEEGGGGGAMATATSSSNSTTARRHRRSARHSSSDSSDMSDQHEDPDERHLNLNTTDQKKLQQPHIPASSHEASVAENTSDVVAETVVSATTPSGRQTQPVSASVTSGYPDLYECPHCARVFVKRHYFQSHLASKHNDRSDCALYKLAVTRRRGRCVDFVHPTANVSPAATPLQPAVAVKKRSRVVLDQMPSSQQQQSCMQQQPVGNDRMVGGGGGAGCVALVQPLSHAVHQSTPTPSVPAGDTEDSEDSDQDDGDDGVMSNDRAGSQTDDVSTAVTASNVDCVEPSLSMVDENVQQHHHQESAGGDESSSGGREEHHSRTEEVTEEQQSHSRAGHWGGRGRGGSLDRGRRNAGANNARSSSVGRRCSFEAGFSPHQRHVRGDHDFRRQDGSADERMSWRRSDGGWRQASGDGWDMRRAERRGGAARGRTWLDSGQTRYDEQHWQQSTPTVGGRQRTHSACAFEGGGDYVGWSSDRGRPYREAEGDWSRGGWRRGHRGRGGMRRLERGQEEGGAWEEGGPHARQALSADHSRRQHIFFGGGDGARQGGGGKSDQYSGDQQLDGARQFRQKHSAAQGLDHQARKRAKHADRDAQNGERKKAQGKSKKHSGKGKNKRFKGDG